MTQLTSRPLICLITEGKLSPDNFETQKAAVLAVIKEAASLNIPLIQIREKSLNASQLFELSRHAVAICRESQTRVVVNDRLDVALAAGAAGIHLPSAGLPATEVRKKVPDEFMVGVSTHSIDEVLSAKAAGADYAFFSPIFDTPKKGPAVGIERLRACCAAAGKFPVLALGGIDGSNYRSVLTAGAAGFASIRFLNDEANLRTIANEYLEQTDDQSNHSN